MKISVKVLAICLLGYRISSSNVISGVVIDSNKSPIFGARITLKHSGIATGTNIDGSWEMQIPSSSGVNIQRIANQKGNRLEILNGRLWIRFSNHDANGRCCLSSEYKYYSKMPVDANRTLAESDVLLIGWNNVIRLSLPLSALQDTIILDTSKIDSDIPWNSDFAYYNIVDERDGQVYKTIEINGQIWMAENLNFRNSSGKSDTIGRAYEYIVDSTIKYGRLYTWNEATIGHFPYDPIENIQGVCPSGWHLPTDLEWKNLCDTSSVNGPKLKSKYGWATDPKSMKYLGNDSLGFRALPGGGGSVRYKGFGGISTSASFWSAKEPPFGGFAVEYSLQYDDSMFIRVNGDKANLATVRCVKNAPGK